MTDPLPRRAPTLVFAWGNASRGDDALGPLLAEHLRLFAAGCEDVDILDDYQLQVEHALDLAGRTRVLFVDASREAAPPFEVSTVVPAPDRVLATHALSPSALLWVAGQALRLNVPPCQLLAIRGEGFELGAPLSEAAASHLMAALDWAQGWLASSDGGDGGSP